MRKIRITKNKNLRKIIIMKKKVTRKNEKKKHQKINICDVTNPFSSYVPLHLLPSNLTPIGGNKSSLNSSHNFINSSAFFFCFADSRTFVRNWERTFNTGARVDSRDVPDDCVSDPSKSPKIRNIFMT